MVQRHKETQNAGHSLQKDQNVLVHHFWPLFLLLLSASAAGTAPTALNAPISKLSAAGTAPTALNSAQ